MSDALRPGRRPLAGRFFVGAEVVITAPVGGVAFTVVQPGEIVGSGQLICRIEDDTPSGEASLRTALQVALLERESARERLDYSRRLAANRRRAPELFPLEEIERSELEVGVAERGLALAELVVERTRSQLVRASRRSRVLAPVSGLVVAVGERHGDYLTAGGEIARLLTSGRPFLRFSSPSFEARGIRLGSPVEAQLLTRRVAGRLTRILPATGGPQGEVLLEAEVTDGDELGVALHGSEAVVEILEERRR